MYDICMSPLGDYELGASNDSTLQIPITLKIGVSKYYKYIDHKQHIKKFSSASSCNNILYLNNVLFILI